MSAPVKLVMIENDEGHPRLSERNIRSSGADILKPVTATPLPKCAPIVALAATDDARTPLARSGSSFP